MVHVPVAYGNTALRILSCPVDRSLEQQSKLTMLSSLPSDSLHPRDFLVHDDAHQRCIGKQDGGVRKPNVYVPRTAQINVSFCKLLFPTAQSGSGGGGSRGG